MHRVGAGRAAESAGQRTADGGAVRLARPYVHERLFFATISSKISSADLSFLVLLRRFLHSSGKKDHAIAPSNPLMGRRLKTAIARLVGPQMARTAFSGP